ncbi:hypothetical protein FRC03_011374 [Tulasnella sp. 419]|nr:hypothetical protein FRC03_011374 [Tulasnella sp. 419]
MSHHPVYHQAATILPGNTSYRVVTPTGSEDEPIDDSSDLEFDDRAYAAKIEKEIGLGQPTDSEIVADLPVLLPKYPSLRDSVEKHGANLDKLRKRIVDFQRTERFVSTRAGTTSSISTSTATGNPIFYLICSCLLIDTSLLSHLVHRDDIYQSKYYALPFEKPVETVYVNRTPEEVEALIRRAIENDRPLAEKARGTVFGGNVGALERQLTVIEHDDGIMSEGSIITVEPLGDPRSRESTMS